MADIATALTKKEEDEIFQKNLKSFVEVLQTNGIIVYIDGVEYERSVANVNLLFRFRRPHCVVQPQSSSQVQVIVREAKQRGLCMTIKNGGHSFAGFSSTNKGILLDLVLMKKVTLDVENQIATVEGGARWGDVYHKLVDGRLEGWIINGGRCPTVGVSGFILGGGLGPFTRSVGMGCDTLLEATIVTADGKEVVVNSHHKSNSDEGKLFFALCGAGGGNFGVVTQLKMKMLRLSNEKGRVTAGMYTHYPEKVDEFVESMVGFYTAKWPETTTIDSSWLCKIGEHNSDLGVRFTMYHDGCDKGFDGLITQHVTDNKLAEQLRRRSLEECSTRFFHETLIALWSEETKTAFPLPGNYAFEFHSPFMFDNKPETIRKVLEIVKDGMLAFREQFKGDSGLLQVTFIHSGGAMSRRDALATAFPWRGASFGAYLKLEFKDKWLEKNMRSFRQKMKTELKQYSIEPGAGYVNFAEDCDPTDHEKVYYGVNREKLREVKEIWDKDRYFTWRQGISRKGESVNPMPGSLPAMAKCDDVADERVYADVVASLEWENNTYRPSYNGYPFLLYADLNSLPMKAEVM